MDADYTSGGTDVKFVSTSEKFMIPLEKEVKGILKMRSAFKVERVGETWIGSWIFADVVREDGSTLPVSLGLRPKKD